MTPTRRDFVRGGVAAFTLSFAAPKFLCDLALAQGAASRNLVVVYLSGGNDSLSMVVPYADPFYLSRRPTIQLSAAQVIQIGRDSNNTLLGLHPRLAGLKTIFDRGRLALIQRTGYENSSRSHFQGTDIWSTASPASTQGPGWLGRYLDTLPAPVDPLAAWNTTGSTPHALQANLVGVPSIPNPAAYAFTSPNNLAEAQNERLYASRISSHVPVNRPHLGFVNATAQAAFETLDRVLAVANYTPSTGVVYPNNNGFAQALKAVAGVLANGIGTRIFWVQTGGYDTHAGQGVQNGGYAGLMTTLNDGLTAFYNDLSNRGLLSQTLILQFSEFGRRIQENGSAGTDHGAASIMMAMGGPVRGNIYGTAPNLNPNGNPTLENGGNDVHYETDFRSVYAKVIDNWLGGDSTKVLAGDFRAGAPDII